MIPFPYIENIVLCLVAILPLFRGGKLVLGLVIPIFLILGIIGNVAPSIRSKTEKFTCFSFLLVLAWIFLQSVPLPQSWIDLLSPQRNILFVQGVRPTLSISPLDTLSHIPWLLSLFVAFCIGLGPRQNLPFSPKNSAQANPILSAQGLSKLLLCAQASGLLCSLCALGHWIFGAELFFGMFRIHNGLADSSRAHFPFVNPDNLSTYLQMCFLLLLIQPEPVKQESGFLHKLSLCSVLLCILLTKSRAGLILTGLALAILSLARLISRRTLMLIAVSACVGVYAGGLQRLQDSSLETLRKDMVEVSVNVIQHFPLTGSGWATWQETAYYFSPYRLSAFKLDFAHNEFLQIASELGAIGTLPLIFAAIYFLYSLGMVLPLIKLAPEYRSIVCLFLALVLPLAHSLIDFPLRSPASGLLWALILGYFLRELSPFFSKREENIPIAEMIETH